MAFSKERCPDDKDLQLAILIYEESHVAMRVARFPPPPPLA